jgi:hypothetical protein
MLRSVVILLAFATLHGCTWYVYDKTNQPISSNIVGRCFVLREDTILSKHFSYYPQYMLNLPGANECTPQDVTPETRNEERYKSSGLRYPKCIWIPVAKIAKETKFRITKVTEWYPWGETRNCWKVEVTIITGKSAGITSNIPSCHYDFSQSELWVRMRSDYQYVEPLELSERVARPCTEYQN